MYNQVNYASCEQFIMNCIQSGMPGMITGNPGLGKTTLPRTIAARLNIGYMELRGELCDSIDLRGLLVPDHKTGTTTSLALDKWPLQSLVDAGSIPKEGILVLDDLPNSDRQVVNGLSEPLIDHSINGDPLGEGWCIICTGNHVGSGASAKPMPSHVVNRVHIVTLIPDWESWAVWANGNIEAELIGYFEMQKGGDLFTYDGKARVECPNEPYLTPRALEGLSRRLQAWRANNPPSDKPPLWLYTACVGDYGSKLYATLDYLVELASWEQLVDDPVSAKMPKSAGAKFAQLNIILSGVKAVAENLQRYQVSVGTYVNRMPAEVAAAVHSRCAGAVPKWSETPAFVKWVTTHKIGM